MRIYLQRRTKGTVAVYSTPVVDFFARGEQHELGLVDELVEGMLASACLVLLQTPTVLLQPLLLIAIYEALLRHRPLVTVLIEGSGYAFSTAKAELSDLAACLDKLHGPGTHRNFGVLLRLRGHRVQDVEQKLLNTIPERIAVRFSVSGGAQRTVGFVEELANRIQSEKNRMTSLDVCDASPGEA